MHAQPDKRFAAKARAALRRGSKKERALCRKDRDAAIHRNELRSYHIGTLGTGHEFSTAGDVVMHRWAPFCSCMQPLKHARARAQAHNGGRCRDAQVGTWVYIGNLHCRLQPESRADRLLVGRWPQF
eukprot:1157791-Pelagomonas_calceolata.AAC.3